MKTRNENLINQKQRGFSKKHTQSHSWAGFPDETVSAYLGPEPFQSRRKADRFWLKDGDTHLPLMGPDSPEACHLLWERVLRLNYSIRFSGLP